MCKWFVYKKKVWSRGFIEWRLWNALVSINNTPHWIRIYFRQYIWKQWRVRVNLFLTQWKFSRFPFKNKSQTLSFIPYVIGADTPTITKIENVFDFTKHPCGVLLHSYPLIIRLYLFTSCVTARLKAFPQARTSALAIISAQCPTMLAWNSCR